MARDYARRLVPVRSKPGVSAKGSRSTLSEARILAAAFIVAREAGRGPAREGALHRPHPPADARGPGGRTVPLRLSGVIITARSKGYRFIEAGRKKAEWRRAAGFGGDLMFGDFFGQPRGSPHRSHIGCPGATQAASSLSP